MLPTQFNYEFYWLPSLLLEAFERAQTGDGLALLAPASPYGMFHLNACPGDHTPNSSGVTQAWHCKYIQAQEL